MWERYHTVRSVDEAVDLLAKYAGSARIVAGATDLILEIEGGLRPDLHGLIDITRIPGLDHITLDDDGWIHLGPLVTHNHCAVSELIIERAYALARACWEVGAPQIRNRGTVAGNLITASPANDSITPLMALDAQVTLRSTSDERIVPLKDFYTGVRQTVMQDDEFMADIAFPAPPEGSPSTFIKLGLRRAQAISIVNIAAVLEMQDAQVVEASIALGSVKPTIVRAEAAEDYLRGKALDDETIRRASELAVEAASPIDDVRASARYRAEMVRVCTRRALQSLADGTERADYPEAPVTLWGPEERHWSRELTESTVHPGTIETVINGRPYQFESGSGKTLLRLLREEGSLTGTKEGCAEGECGACTVDLDGMAVMACMVPAPRAHGAEIRTVEGLSSDGALHPIQRGFIEAGAVQCGYCTPGFLMSGAMLLEERPDPDTKEIRQSITGNLCRCTGYYSIVSAFERAAELSRDSSNLP
ncbi:MAG: FAD binding domain-containing protein [Anaerolineales bacterium]